VPRLFDAPHLFALSATLLVEAVGLAALAAASGRGRRFAWRCGLVALAVNLASHTAFWTGFPFLARRGLSLPAAEGMVALVEGLAYRAWCPLPLGWALLAAATLNFASLVLGGEAWRRLG
jgi:hypothetical protein